MLTADALNNRRELDVMQTPRPFRYLASDSLCTAEGGTPSESWSALALAWLRLCLEPACSAFTDDCSGREQAASSVHHFVVLTVLLYTVLLYTYTYIPGTVGIWNNGDCLFGAAGDAGTRHMLPQPIEART